MNTVSYVVRDGDYLTALAYRFGTTVAEILALPQNDRLKKLRPNPEILAPTDVVYLPESAAHVPSRHRARRRVQERIRGVQRGAREVSGDGVGVSDRVRGPRPGVGARSRSGFGAEGAPRRLLQGERGLVARYERDSEDFRRSGRLYAR